MGTASVSRLVVRWTACRVELCGYTVRVAVLSKSWTKLQSTYCFRRLLVWLQFFWLSVKLFGSLVSQCGAVCLV